jgi:hypothetical protein
MTRNIVWTLTGTVALLIAAASAARAEEKLIARVPFDFVVGNLTMPAGNYVVTEREDPGIVSIANQNGHDFTFVLTIANVEDEQVAEPELVFEQVGGQRFLARIVTGEGEGREIPLKAGFASEKIDRVAAASFR